MIRQLAVLPLFLGLPALGATASQTPEPSPATLKVSTEVVNVLAVVRDKDDRLVPDLTREDFELSEDNHAQAMRYFSRETDTPLLLGVLMDTSASQKRVLPEERERAKAFIRQVMQPQDQGFVLRFDRKAELLQGLTSHSKLLCRAIDSLVETAPTTHLFDAVKTASEVLRKEDGRKVLVLLTDGFDTLSHTRLTTALHAAQEADAVIYCLAVSDPWTGLMPFYRLRAQITLKKLSRGTGGRVIRVGPQHEMAQAFNEVAEELRTEYLLGYTSSNGKHDGKFRRIDVRACHGTCKVQARRGYYAPKD